MASEWATEKAAHLTAVLDAQSVQHQSARILAEALDAARKFGIRQGIEGMKIGALTPSEIVAYLRYKQTCEGRMAICTAIDIGTVCAEHVACAQLLGEIIRYLEVCDYAK